MGLFYAHIFAHALKTYRRSRPYPPFLPTDFGVDPKIETWIYILILKEQGRGYKRIVRHLNERDIPGPDAGQIRMRNGVPYEVSGHWSVSTVRALCTNRAILGLLDFGRRSAGKHRRLSKNGARPLENTDHNQKKKPKVIMNDPSLLITSTLQGEPQFDLDRWDKIQAETLKRSKGQRGIPHVRDPVRYPLASRIIDLSDDCMSILYGHKNGKRLVYTCGKYMATSGAKCENNTVDAEAVLGFTLNTLQELIDRLGSREKLRQRLIERAAREQPEDPLRLQQEQQRAKFQATVTQLEKDLGAAQRNYTIEENPKLKQVVYKQMMQIEGELTKASAKLDAIPESKAVVRQTPEEEADRALGLLDDIQRIARDPAARAEILSLLQQLGMKIGLQFVGALKKTRRVRRLVGGVIVFGDAPFPVKGGTNPTNDSPAGNTPPDSDGLYLQPCRCENRQDRNPKRENSGSRCMPPEAFRSPTCPQEGVSSTKGQFGKLFLTRSLLRWLSHRRVHKKSL